jgi:hypothetical protein
VNLNLNIEQFVQDVILGSGDKNFKTEGEQGKRNSQNKRIGAVFGYMGSDSRGGKANLQSENSSSYIMVDGGGPFKNMMQSGELNGGGSPASRGAAEGNVIFGQTL